MHMNMIYISKVSLYNVHAYHYTSRKEEEDEEQKKKYQKF